MSKVIDYIVENDLLPLPIENWAFDKEYLFDEIKSWNGIPFAYYDRNKNRIECDTPQKQAKLLEYIAKDSVMALNCGFFAARVLGVKDEILTILVENNEDIYWVVDPTL